MKLVSIYTSALLLLASCSLQDEQAAKLNRKAVIFPDYTETTLPCNMAAPTFASKDSETLSNLQAVFSAGGCQVVVGNNGEEGFCIDPSDWKELINESMSMSKSESMSMSANEGRGFGFPLRAAEQNLPSRGSKVMVKIQGKKNGAWVEYDPFSITISPDSIDSHLAYRLIEPGYEVWGKMGIYERDLESYEEKPIVTNGGANGGCVNCHSFCNYDRNKMLYHKRLEDPGTYFFDGKETKSIAPSPSFVYPSWHPDGRLVAFSTNKTKQAFHTVSRNRIEVFDFDSDILIYDTHTGETITCPEIHSSGVFETFPSWAPDGKKLYYCSADSVTIPDEYDKVRYSLCSIDFDAKSRTFGSNVDTLYNIKSVSFPQVSPDNKYLMFTLAAYGTFSIWHKDADLYLLDLSTREVRNISELNSKDVESYHCWSSNGKWVVFSTRREDGLYTRSYFAHFENGKFSKPFAMPQIDADFTNRLMKSYNRPEFFK